MVKRERIFRLNLMALGIAINVVLGTLAVVFKLPIYLDTLGTLFIATTFGPWYGMVTGLGSGLVNGMMDPYAFYFIPVQLIIGGIAGLLQTNSYLKPFPLPLKAILITLPGTLVSSFIAAYLFGGITSSGSSFIVQLLHGWGFNLVLSVFVVQLLTDYIDRLLMLLFVSILLTKTKVLMDRKEVSHGTLQ